MAPLKPTQSDGSSGVLTSRNTLVKTITKSNIARPINKPRDATLGPKAKIVNEKATTANATFKCNCGKAFTKFEILQKHEKMHTPRKKDLEKKENILKTDVSMLRSAVKESSLKSSLVSSAKKIVKKKVIAHGGVPLSDRMKKAIIGVKL